jgi:predicted acyl esterase
MHSHIVRCFLSFGLLALGLGYYACSSPNLPQVSSDPGNARFQVRESVEQLQITHADPGVLLALSDGYGRHVDTEKTDSLGSLIFRQVTPGSGYVVTVAGSSPLEYSRQLTVMSVDGSTPPQSFYNNQQLSPGFGYITTRDGTQLSVYITLPGPVEDGPYPTVIDYSGYAPSEPGMPVPNEQALCPEFPTLCNAPNDPSGVLASLVGYATVSVNMRGTGCSGGAYDYFETLQLLDGYDVIETVAAQNFVAFNKVGMTGISYPGIAQLFVASVHPPSLAAITPLSVIGNTATTLMPGGILNSGFAIEWVTSVLNGAAPYGQGWEQGRVNAGDTVCAENQLLHDQRVDNVQQAYDTPYYIPAMADPLNPTYFAPQIEVPIFLAGAWQDEQTGPFFTTLLNRFSNAPLVRFTVYNGVHEDGFAPQVMAEWKYFLDFFVARTIPSISPQLRSFAPLLFEQVYNSDLLFPPERFDSYTNYQDALDAYRMEPPLRAIFEDGGGSDPGAPQGMFEQSYAQWPPNETAVQRYYFHADGSLSASPPTETAASSAFLLDPDAGNRGNLAPGGNVDDKLPAYDYEPLVTGHAAAFLTDPLPADLLFLGTGSADLWLESTADDADLQVVVTEVRPDGQEMYVQAGWLRASFRKLGPDSTPLWPSPTYLQQDITPLPTGQWSQVRVPIAGFGHAFRAGSRIRVSVDTPGGTRPLWRFLNKTFSGPVTHTISHSVAYPSSVALSLIPGATVPSPLPACPSLRGQPCRAYVPYVNTPGNSP